MRDVHASSTVVALYGLTCIPRIERVENDETVLRVVFYNVGMQQSALDTKTSERAEKRWRLLHAASARKGYGHSSRPGSIGTQAIAVSPERSNCTAPVIPLSLQTFSRPFEKGKRGGSEEAQASGRVIRNWRACVWKLKLDAHLARKALRDGEELLEEIHARRVHVPVDRANVAHGDGIARTHDFGLRPGENMCRDVPIEVRAHLRTLQRSEELVVAAMVLQSPLQTFSFVSGVTGQLILNLYDAVAISFWCHLHLSRKTKKVHLHLCQPS